MGSQCAATCLEPRGPEGSLVPQAGCHMSAVAWKGGLVRAGEGSQIRLAPTRHPVYYRLRRFSSFLKGHLPAWVVAELSPRPYAPCPAGRRFQSGARRRQALPSECCQQDGENQKRTYGCLWSVSEQEQLTPWAWKRGEGWREFSRRKRLRLERGRKDEGIPGRKIRVGKSQEARMSTLHACV